MIVYIHVIASAILFKQHCREPDKVFVLAAHGVIKCYRRIDIRVEVRHVRKSPRTQIPPFFFIMTHIHSTTKEAHQLFLGQLWMKIYFTPYSLAINYAPNN